MSAFESIDVNNRRVLCVLGNRAGTTVPDGLAAQGARVERVEGYVTREADVLPEMVKAAVLSGTVDIVTLASPASVAVLVRQLGAGMAALSGACLVAVGPTTRQAMIKAGLPVHIVARQPTAEQVVADCREYFATRFG